MLQHQAIYAARITVRGDTMVKNDILYECDPLKNTECSKDRCYTNGGACILTHQPECAKEGLRSYTREELREISRKELGIRYESEKHIGIYLFRAYK